LLSQATVALIVAIPYFLSWWSSLSVALRPARTAAAEGTGGSKALPAVGKRAGTLTPTGD
jgi:hypothetical protein